MPTYRSIEVTLHTQFDVDTIPEYYPEPEAARNAGLRGFIPELVDDKTSTCSVYVPYWPGSIFWISYTVLPPIPDENMFFFFKLYINEVHIVNWSTGKEDRWTGKTMFGLFEEPSEVEGNRKLQKRVLRFTPADEYSGSGDGAVDLFDETARIELRVHRAHARKRVERQMQLYSETEHAKAGGAIDFVNAGRAPSNHPKRFYKFALIDPVDQPFATFRYHYRTMEQIKELGLLHQHANTIGEECDLSVIEPSVAEQETTTESYLSKEMEEVSEDSSPGAVRESRAESPSSGHSDDRSTHDSWVTAAVDIDAVETKRPSTGCSIRDSDNADQPKAYIPRGAPSSDSGIPSAESNQGAQSRDSFANTSPRFYRLSIPPAVKFSPPKFRRSSRALPTIPQKQEALTCTSYRPQPPYPIEHWTTRTPSPVKSIRESITGSPTLDRRTQGRSAASLVNMITSSWKRRGSGPSSLPEDKNSGKSSVLSIYDS